MVTCCFNVHFVSSRKGGCGFPLQLKTAISGEPVSSQRWVCFNVCGIDYTHAPEALEGSMRHEAFTALEARLSGTTPVLLPSVLPLEIPGVRLREREWGYRCGVSVLRWGVQG